MIVQPGSLRGRCMRMKGKGTSILLNGSAGVAGTLTSSAASPGNLSPSPMGGAISKAITSKLDRLKVAHKCKPSNIRFSI